MRPQIRILVFTLSVISTLAASAASVHAEQGATSATPRALQPKLDSMKARFVARVPKEQVDLYEKANRELETSGILDRALNVNDTVPDFSLPNASGDSVSLVQLLAQGPIVLTWYRGGWCPYCNLALSAWTEWLPELEKAGGNLVAISPEVPDSSLSTSDRMGQRFEVLSDQGNRVARQFGIVYKLPDPIIESYNKFFSLSAYNGNEDYELPLAATYVIGSDRVIRYAFLDTDYKRRAEPAEVIRRVAEIRKKS